MTWLTDRYGAARPPKLGRMMTAVAAVAFAHMALFVLLNQSRAPAILPEARGVPIWLVDGANLPSLGKMKTLTQVKTAPTVTPRTIQTAALKPKAAEPLKISNVAQTIQMAPEIAQPILAPSLAAAQPASAAGGASGGQHCEIFDVVQSALQTSQPVRAAIAAIPASARSVANAILIWDGHWADPASMGGLTALTPIQQVVLDGVASAPRACQGDVVAGPRLITVGDQHNTTILAFGSGTWRWSDLATTALQP